jgi:hypothetical protein
MRRRFSWKYECFPACTYRREQIPLKYLLPGSDHKMLTSKHMQLLKFLITLYIRYTGHFRMYSRITKHLW